MRRWMLLAAFLPACGSPDDTRSRNAVAADAAAVSVAAAYSVGDSSHPIADVALYQSDSGLRLITTGHDRLIVRDVRDGSLIREVGASGSGMGELRDPVAITVLGDSIALVVERGNARIQGFHLPDFATVGTLGDRMFEQPGDIAAYAAGNAYAVFIADDTKAGFARVTEFRLTVGKGELIAIHWRTFGDSTGPGSMRSPVALATDGAHRRLVVLDGDSSSRRLRVYDSEGRFTGREYPAGAGTHGQVALHACPDGSGYWLVTEPRSGMDAFHVLDRSRFERLAVFSTEASEVTGLAAAARPFEAFRSGVLVVSTRRGTMTGLPWHGIVARFPVLKPCAE